MTSPRIIHTTIALDGDPDGVRLDDISDGTLVLRLGDSVNVLLGAASPALLHRLAAVADDAAVAKERAGFTLEVTTS